MILKIDEAECTGCRHCYEVCPMDVYTWDEEKGKPIVSYEEECQMCFICQEECPVAAINVKIPIIFW